MGFPIFTAVGTGVGAYFGGPTGAAAGGAIGGGIDSYLGGTQANAENRDIMERQLQWEGEMSDTAHQREVKDLQAAGLNPLLSLNSGASTPSAPGATMQNAAQGMASSASQIAQMAYGLNKLDADTKLVEAQKKNVDMDTLVKSGDAPNAEAKNTFWNFLKKSWNDAQKYNYMNSNPVQQKLQQIQKLQKPNPQPKQNYMLD